MNGFVYIMRCGDYAKIGYSRDPQKRMAQMDRCLPVQPTLVAIYPGSRAIETKLHRHLARHHCRYEWFRWCADIEVIASRGLPDLSHIGPMPQSRRAPPALWNMVESARAPND